MANSVFISVGFRNTILDYHGFRQTQTAISSYYTIKEGYRLAYETPVLGKPWSIPFEFPLYQWIVAFLSQASNIKLEQSGRLVSMIFFYLSLLAIFHILRSLSIEREYCCISIVMMLCCPVYIFWSRTFMIESLAVFLSLIYLLCFMKFYKNRKIHLFVIGALFGGLAAAVKITTLIVVTVPIIAILSNDWLSLLQGLLRKNSNNPSLNRFQNEFKYAMLLVVPYLMGLMWTRFADFHKSLNPLARDFITSTHLIEWNFGTWSQKLSLDCWEKIMVGDVIHGIGYPAILIIPLFVFITSSYYICAVIFSLIAYLSGPIIFTNLYYTHRYYCYANSLFLILAISLSIIALIKTNKMKKFALYGLIPFCIITMIYSYLSHYYMIQSPTNGISRPPVECLLIRAVTAPDDVVLIYGEDWNPTIPFYAERRAVMNRSNLPLSDPRFQESIRTTGKERISVMVKDSRDEGLNAFFSFHPDPVMTCVYLRKDLYKSVFMRMFHVDVEQSSSALPVKISFWNRRFRLFSATGSTMVVPLPAPVSKLRAQFGVLFDPRDAEILAGVDFVIAHESHDGVRTELSRTHLDPVRSEADREVRNAEVELAKRGAGKILLETVPGAGKTCKWSFWSDIELN